MSEPASEPTSVPTTVFVKSSERGLSLVDLELLIVRRTCAAILASTARLASDLDTFLATVAGLDRRESEFTRQALNKAIEDFTSAVNEVESAAWSKSASTVPTSVS
jgi:hypothetical protein